MFEHLLQFNLQLPSYLIVVFFFSFFPVFGRDVSPSPSFDRRHGFIFETLPLIFPSVTLIDETTQTWLNVASRSLKGRKRRHLFFFFFNGKVIYIYIVFFF